MATASKQTHHADSPDAQTHGPQTLAPQPRDPGAPPSSLGYCSACQFYSALGSLCRYSPPQAIYGSNQTTMAGQSVSSPVPFWPQVNASVDWCGQWSPVP